MDMDEMPERVTDRPPVFMLLAQNFLFRAAGIDRLIADLVLLTDFGKQNYASYRKKFILSGMLTNTVDVYEEALIS